jgi:hypothetical protein
LRECELRLVGHILAAKDKNRMLLERGARLLVRGVVGRDLGERHAAQLGGEARTQRDDFHRRALHRFGVCSAFHQNQPAGKEALYTREISFDPGLLRITIIRSGRFAAAAKTRGAA